MLKLARGSSNFSLSSVDYDRPVEPKKDSQKRKNVHFNDAPEAVEVEHTMSTATFLRQKGMAWNSLARAFGCEEDFTKDDVVVMEELLNLCSFWSDSEPVPDGIDEQDDSDDSDSDDDLECLRRLAAFSSSVSTVPPISTHCSSDVSTLRLNSVLRLNNQSCRSANSNEALDRLSCTIPNAFLGCGSLTVKSQSISFDEVENAFKGTVNDDNEFSEDPVYVSTSSDDFWSQVEF